MKGKDHHKMFGTYLGCPPPEDQRDHPGAHSSRLSRFNTHAAALHDGHTWLDEGTRFCVRKDERGYFWATCHDTWLLVLPYLSETSHLARGSELGELGDCTGMGMDWCADVPGTRHNRARLPREGLSV